MMICVDTGVLLRIFRQEDPNYQNVRDALKQLRRSGEQLTTFPQNAAEFWVVCTRPIAQNGYGLSVEQTLKQLTFIDQIGVVLPEHADAYEHWKNLVLEYQVHGKTTHDTRIVAQMVAHGVSNILTLNPKDFVRYDGLSVTTPEDVLAK